MKSTGMRAACALALCVAPVTFAAGPGGSVDLYYVPSIEIEGSGGGGSATMDGDGFGIRGMVLPVPQFALTGEYQASTLEDDATGAFTGTPGADVDFDQFRVGAGFLVQGASGIFAEYISGEFSAGGGSADMDGFAIHGRLGGEVAPNLSLYGQIGWLMLSSDLVTFPADEDFDGWEFNLGGAFAFNPQFGVFLDYRLSNIEGDMSNVELETSEFRVGGRLMF
jgi:hypothetical protein